jgi:hypothetical protein
VGDYAIEKHRQALSFMNFCLRAGIRYGGRTSEGVLLPGFRRGDWFMKARLLLLSTFVLLWSLAAAAGTIYENGPVSGDYSAYRFNSPNFVSNSFRVSGGNSTINGLSIWVLIFMTDHNPTAEVTITSQPNGGTVYFDQTIQFTESNCYANGWGYNICLETVSWTNGPALQDGTYWVTLKNGSIPSGADFGWDQNSGFGCSSPGCPSQAQYSFGTIPSEAFTLLGTSGENKGAAPKTTSLLLFSSGFVGLLGLVRRSLG